jgi:hypothetical protein
MTLTRFVALAIAASAMICVFPAWATTVYVTSVGYAEVQLIVNGQNLRSLRIGEESPEGVKLTDVQNGVAVLEIDGR